MTKKYICLSIYSLIILMKIIKSLVVNIVICWALLYLFNYYQLWINIEFINNTTQNSLIDLIWVFLILWLIFRIFNFPIKWILKTLSCPINFLTLWLLSLAINVLIFYLFAFVANNLLNWEIVVHLWTVLQTLILSFIMAIWFSILKKIL